VSDKKRKGMETIEELILEKEKTRLVYFKRPKVSRLEGRKKRETGSDSYNERHYVGGGVRECLVIWGGGGGGPGALRSSRLTREKREGKGGFSYGIGLRSESKIQREGKRRIRNYWEKSQGREKLRNYQMRGTFNYDRRDWGLKKKIDEKGGQE